MTRGARASAARFVYNRPSARSVWRIGDPETVHILFFVEDFPVARRAGGGLRISIRRQAEGLLDRCRVTVVILRRVLPPLARYRKKKILEDAALPRDPALTGDAPPHGLRVLSFRYPHIPVLWPITEPLQCLALALWAWFRHARDAAVLHGHCVYPTGAPAALLGRLFARPSVVTAYGADLYVHAAGVHAAGESRAPTWWARLALQMATRVVAVSESLLSQLAALGVEGERRRLVPSGVDVDRFTPPADLSRLRLELGLPRDAHIFLAPSLFMPVKGHATLVDAFQKLLARRPRAYLVLTGDGPLREDIGARIEAAGIGRRVRFTGFLDYDDLPRWMAAADVIVLPSLNEGMPLAILEGFACGKPAVGSAVGGIPELVHDDRFGLLVPPADAGALAIALEDAMDRPWDRELLRSRAEDFRWERVVEALHAVYADIAGGAGGPVEGRPFHARSTWS